MTDVIDDIDATQMIGSEGSSTLDARAEARAARDRSLGKVAQTDDPVQPPAPVHKRTTDRFLGSLGLFLLRLVLAGIIGIHGYQHVTSVNTFTDFLAKVGLPSAHYLAWGIGIAEMLAAVALLFGLLTRIAGLGVCALMVGALVKVMWGAANPFHSGVSGFTGELELMLAAVGFVIFCLGAGRWSIDGSFRATRQRNKAGV